MNKKNLILGGVLVVMVLLAYLSEGPLRNWNKNQNKQVNFFADLNVDQIDKISINKQGSDISFEKNISTTGSTTSEKWRISGTKGFYLTDDIQNGVINTLKELSDADFTLVSENSSKKNEFRVDNETGVKVVFQNGDKIVRDFILGKMTSDFSGSYLTKKDDNNTYSIKVASLNSAFVRDDWYNKVIFSAELNKINKIRFQYPTREFTVEKKDSDWVGTLPYSFRVNNEKIEAISEIMSNLTAVKIPAQTFEGTGLEKHEIIVEATGEGINNLIMIGTANEDGLYYTKRGDSDNIYLISKEQRDELEKKIWQLR